MKLLFKLIFSLIMLVVVAVVALPFIIDPNDFKEQITQQVEQHTGRKLTLGSIQLSYFPWLGVELKQVALGNAAGFGDKPFAQVEQAGVRVKLKPLLQKRLEVDTIVLQGLKAHLIKAADGRSNWDDLAKGGKAGKSDDKQEASPLAALLIGGVELRDALFIFEDRATGKGVQMSGLNLLTGSFEPGRPIDLELTSNVQTLPKGPAYRTGLAGRAAFDPARNRLSVTGLKLNVADLDGPQTLDLTGQVQMDTAMQLLNIKDLNLAAKVLPPGSKQTIDVTLSSQLAASIKQLHLSLAPFAVEVTQVKGGPKAKLTGKLNANMSKGVAVLNNLQGSYGGLKLKGELQGSSLLTKPKMKGSFVVPRFNPRQVLKSLGMAAPKTTDPVALSKADMRFSVAGSPAKLKISKLKLKLDSTAVNGNASVAMGGKPRLGFKLNVNAIDLNRYLPPPSAAPAKGQDAALPLGALFAADMNGSIGIGSLKVNRFKADNLSLKIKQSGGKLTVNQSIGSFYKGKYNGVAVLKAAGKVPSLYYKASVKGVEAEPLLKAVSGEDRLRGKGDCNLELRSQGKTSTAMTNNVRGDLTFKFRNGAIKGFNMAQTIREARSKIAQLQGKTPAPAPAETQETDFSVLDAKAKIKGRIVNNTSLKMKSPYLRFDGKGTLDTAKQWMDYNLTTVVVESHRGQGGKEFKELNNIPLPMSYKGPIAQISDWRKWRIHFDKVLQAKLEQKAEDEARKLLQEKLGLPKDAAASKKEFEKQLEEKAKDELKGVLKGLF